MASPMLSAGASTSCYVSSPQTDALVEMLTTLFMFALGYAAFSPRFRAWPRRVFERVAEARAPARAAPSPCCADCDDDASTEAPDSEDDAAAPPPSLGGGVAETLSAAP
eukprot:CAMPEP_0176315952 /NCGR_PEP_ID=MMETSP0121_2-20121125/68477_1 /TAXON_ID=160619 /ORGANISM="Kryptoperidinium foliaceum, Strain CCMP 1326" /LENGTH=108 /DNA_ID=CAMNT_0017658137 /DNA_START=12 /DNA_END=335 /DNA_ORIENTATION=+